MKVKVLQEDFSKAISTVNRFVNPRVQLPILGNIILKASKTNFTLLATNLELSIAKKVGASVEEEGEIAIPGKIIAELVLNLPKGQITLESKNEQLKITSDKFSGKVSGMVTTDFPKVTESIGKKSITLPVGDLKHCLSKVSFCASVDEARPTINGVLFIFEKKNLTLVATDGFRLSQKSIKLGEEISLDRIILPKAAILEILRIEEEKENLLVEVNEKDNQITFVSVDFGIMFSNLGKVPEISLELITISPTPKVI